jgi:hypothetical protein
VLFEKDIKPVADELLKDMAASADASLEIEGRRALRFVEEWNHQEWTFLVAFPTPSLLVVATDEKYLRELIMRIDRGGEASFLRDKRLKALLPLDDIVWAVRCYKEPVLDPGVPPGAKGFVCRFIDLKIAHVTFLADKRVSAQSVRDMWTLFPPIGTAPKLKDTGGGAFEIEHEGRLNAFLLLLLLRLGHAADK